MFSKFRLPGYDRRSLPVKISLPFILMFLFFWITGTWILGQYFKQKLESNKIRQSQILASLVEREFDLTIQGLRRDARLLAHEGKIVDNTAAQSTAGLQREILPLKAILESDIVAVFGQEQETALFDSRQPILSDHVLDYKSSLRLLMTGAEVDTIIQSTGPPVLIGSAPIKNQAGVIGGLVLGIAISDDLLMQMNALIQEQLVVVFNGDVIASTFEMDAANRQWLLSTLAGSPQTTLNQDYIAHPIAFDGLDGDHFDLVLLASLDPLNAAKRRLQLAVMLVSVVGASATTVIGYLLARGFAKPIQSITQVARQVVQCNNFELRATATSQDEIGTLADSLNQLIEWVGQYTHDLEQASQTLEDQVELRTQELSSALLELKDTQGQLIQTEKMSSLGQMVAGIAHEINNPINFIQGNLRPLSEYFQDLLDLLETYQSEYPQPTEAIIDKQDEVDLEFLLEDSTKILNSMKMGTQRVRDIVVSLRNYSRLDEATIKDVDLHEGLDGTLLILNHRLKLGVDVIKHYGDLPLVRCSPAQLNQVFTNIVANALDAMFEADVSPKQLIITTQVLEADRVEIRLRDTGPGMPPEVKAKIFDPFFTTKAVGKGTGLGMGICYKIIQQHQGTLEVNTAPGQGAEFVITLPKEAFLLDAERLQLDKPPLAAV